MTRSVIAGSCTNIGFLIGPPPCPPPRFAPIAGTGAGHPGPTVRCVRGLNGVGVGRVAGVLLVALVLLAVGLGGCVAVVAGAGLPGDPGGSSTGAAGGGTAGSSADGGGAAVP